MVCMEVKPGSSANIHTLEDMFIIPSLAMVGREMAKRFPNLSHSLSFVYAFRPWCWATVSIRQPACFENHTNKKSHDEVALPQPKEFCPLIKFFKQKFTLICKFSYDFYFSL